jgi:hypothetical protein
MAAKEEETISELTLKMDRFLAEFGTSNINRKANDIGPVLIKFLSSHPDVINEYGEISNFIEGLGTHWVNNQNPKVFYAINK